MKILVIVAHPDDEVLGCGGTIARLAHENHEVYISILGEGITSRYQQREQAEQTGVMALRSQSRRVSKTLGAQDIFFYDFPDNRFDTVPLLDVIKTVEELIELLTPEVIYTHHGSDLNIDHCITHRAVLTATRPIQDHPVREVYAFEVPSSTEWGFQCVGSAFNPNVFVDVSETLDVKILALQHYDTEIRVFPHPRSPEAIHATASRWGSVAGCGAAEAFQLVRAFRL